MYRRQRHIYDLSRKFYLLGRDEAIARLHPAPGDKVLEIGCGTGRDLVKTGARILRRGLFGLDVSREMLATAAASSARAGLASRIALAQADVTAFDRRRYFRLRKFRARDDLVHLVDDPTLARGARLGRLTLSRQADRWRSSISAITPACPAFQGGTAALACRLSMLHSAATISATRSRHWPPSAA